MFRFRKLVIRLMNKIEKIPGIFLISALILNIIFFNWLGNLIFVSPPPLNSDDSVRKITYEINSSSNFQNKAAAEDKKSVRNARQQENPINSNKRITEAADKSPIKNKEKLKPRYRQRQRPSPRKEKINSKQMVVEKKNVENTNNIVSTRNKAGSRPVSAAADFKKEKMEAREADSSQELPERENMTKDEPGTAKKEAAASNFQTKSAVDKTAGSFKDRENKELKNKSKQESGRSQETKPEKNRTEKAEVLDFTPGGNEGAAGNDKESGGLEIKPPSISSRISPDYPRLMRKRGIEGRVVLEVVINSQGRVENMKISESSGFASLDKAAAAAVKKWTFEPAFKEEKAVAARVLIPIKFRLK